MSTPENARELVLRAMTEPNVWGHYTPETAQWLLTEVLYGTPLFLAQYDGVESELHLTLEDARSMCDDVARVDAHGRYWDWTRDEHGVHVQFFTHPDDDRPLHMTGGTVTEIRVTRPRHGMPCPSDMEDG